MSQHPVTSVPFGRALRCFCVHGVKTCRSAEQSHSERQHQLRECINVCVAVALLVGNVLFRTNGEQLNSASRCPFACGCSRSVADSTTAVRSAVLLAAGVLAIVYANADIVEVDAGALAAAPRAGDTAAGSSVVVAVASPLGTARTFYRLIDQSL